MNFFLLIFVILFLLPATISDCLAENITTQSSVTGGEKITPPKQASNKPEQYPRKPETLIPFLFPKSEYPVLFETPQKDCENIISESDLLTSAADKGNPSAQYILAQNYALGSKDFKQDTSKAFDYFRRSAEQDYSGALEIMGKLYASDLKNLFARNNTFKSFTKEIALPVDYKEAGKWFLRAAEQGDKESQYFLGILFRDGLGVKQNFSEAYFWIKLSNLYADDTHYLEKLITVEERISAQDRIEAWKPKRIVHNNADPVVNVQAFLCGKDLYRLIAAGTCGDIIHITRGIHDGPHYFVNKKTKLLVASCTSHRCSLPKEWDCSYPRL